jgi:hypothetical protein
MGGDVISNLMEMESGRAFDSHKDTLSVMIKEGAKVVTQVRKSKVVAAIINNQDNSPFHGCGGHLEK